MATDRLVLRPSKDGDVDVLLAIWRDPDVRRYLWDDVEISRDQAAAAIACSERTFHEEGFGIWTVALRSNPRPIGFCGYYYFRDPPERELVFGLLPAHWHRGLATEAAAAILRYGFETLRFDRVVGSTDAPNAASCRVMERLGMRRTRRAVVGGRDTIFYEIDRAAHGTE